MRKCINHFFVTLHIHFNHGPAWMGGCFLWESSMCIVHVSDSFEIRLWTMSVSAWKQPINYFFQVNNYIVR